MKDWVARLDDFLKMTGKEILNHSGTVSHEQVIEKARIKFEKHKATLKDEISQVEENFIKQITEVEKKLGKKKQP
jgi:hypothetical protein